MIRTLVIGDPHLKLNNIKESEILINTSIEWCKNNKPDIVIILGDTLDSHEKINLQLLTKAIKWFTTLSKICLTIVLIGNHERINNKVFCDDIHPFLLVKNISKNLKIIDQPEIILINEIKIALCPYVECGKFNKALSRIDMKDIKVIFAHQEFKGCNQETFISKDGDIWSHNNPLIISGHIHKYQKLGDNIFYPGSPFQHSFGESGDDKGIFDITIKKDGSYEDKKIELNIIKKHTRKMLCKDLKKEDVSKIKNTRIYLDKKPSKEVNEELIKNGNKIVIDPVYKNHKIVKNSFNEILLELIKDDEKLIQINKELNIDL